MALVKVQEKALDAFILEYIRKNREVNPYTKKYLGVRVGDIYAVVSGNLQFISDYTSVLQQLVADKDLVSTASVTKYVGNEINSSENKQIYSFPRNYKFDRASFRTDQEGKKLIESLWVVGKKKSLLFKNVCFFIARDFCH